MSYKLQKDITKYCNNIFFDYILLIAAITHSHQV